MSTDEFTPDKRLNPRGARFPFLSLKDGGATDDPARVWSGDVLMDLTRYEALQMRLLPVDGEPYLFIESGGFSPRHPADGQSTWHVLRRE